MEVSLVNLGLLVYIRVSTILKLMHLHKVRTDFACQLEVPLIAYFMDSITAMV